jgi:hypothetical protein
MQEEQVHQPKQSEGLPSGALPFDAPDQLFPKGLNEIDDEQTAHSTPEGGESSIQPPPEVVVESV